MSAWAVGLWACTDAASNVATVAERFAPGTTADFEFTSSGVQLSGVLDVPAAQPAQALILFVHGYGETDVRGWSMYAGLRSRFTELGIATAIWDKPGQGRSGGTFDINQPVAESAQEVVDAANYLRKIHAPGAHYIGIWGVSRAGWIAPIALSRDRDLEFWVSVSGVSAEDNFSYLLLSNLPYEGGSHELSARLADEWRAGCEVFRGGGSYAAYQEATQALQANEYINRMRGGWPTWAEYELQQKYCTLGACTHIDDDMCSFVHIEKFDEMLAALDVDMLALFGEKDLNVDWRKTRQLYEQAVGSNGTGTLVVKTFADADHNLNVAENGSLKEMQGMTSSRKSDGFYQVQIDWLRKHVVERD